MRILLASNSLSALGGSETYLLTLGRHLQRFGHEVFVVEGPGGEGTLADQAGLLQVPVPSAVPDRPDRAIVQDAIVAGDVAAAWPDVPQLFVVHSSIHDLQLTSALPSSVAMFVTLNDTTATRARALAGSRPVARLTQPIDVGHFTPGPPPRPLPKQVLLFGNNKASWRYEGLERACAQRGIEVRRAGEVGGRRLDDPAGALRDADIVVGYGRCILEAMATGRTAFVFDRFGSDGWVTSTTYPELESTGFAGAAGLDEPGRSSFEAVLDAYDPADGAVGHDLAFRNHHARTHAVAILELLEPLGPVEPADPLLSFTLARVWREAWRWETQVVATLADADQVRNDLRAVEGRAQALTDELAAREAELAELRVRTDAAEQRLEAVLASRRYRIGAAVARLDPRGRRVDRTAEHEPSADS